MSSSSTVRREPTHTFSTIVLPVEGLLRLVVSFLEVEQQARVQRVCKSFARALGTHTVLKLRRFTELESSSKIKPLLPKQIHCLKSIESIDAKCRWKDQCWGNRKGALYLSVFRANPRTMILERLARHSLFGIAPHSRGLQEVSTRLSAETTPFMRLLRKGDILQVEMRSGGGGGHSLTVGRFQLVVTWRNTRKRATALLLATALPLAITTSADTGTEMWPSTRRVADGLFVVVTCECGTRMRRILAREIATAVSCDGCQVTCESETYHCANSRDTEIHEGKRTLCDECGELFFYSLVPPGFWHTQAALEG